MDSPAERVAELQRQTLEVRSKRDQEHCVSMLMIAGIVTPFLVWILLYWLQPSFVQKKEGTKYVRDNGQVLKWTVIITVGLWMVMYLFTYCTGYDPKSGFCIRW
jgi:hypothetical protein